MSYSAVRGVSASLACFFVQQGLNMRPWVWKCKIMFHTKVRFIMGVSPGIFETFLLFFRLW